MLCFGTLGIVGRDNAGDVLGKGDVWCITWLPQPTKVFPSNARLGVSASSKHAVLRADEYHHNATVRSVSEVTDALLRGPFANK